MSMEERPADAEESAVPSRRHSITSAPEGAATFFSTPELRQRLDLLRHLTDNSEKILLIKGVEGSGKSTLLQQYRWLSRDEWMVCPLTADHMLQPDQFFSLLYRRFGLTDPAAASLDGLIKRFEMLHIAGRLPVIVVDDAHLLPVATLIALFRLFERRPGNRALIRVVLLATPEISTQFQTPQLQAMNLQSVQALDMPLFDMAQAQAFLEFLLDAEGKKQDLDLVSGRIERIIRDSAGVPGVLEAQLRSVFAVAPHQVPELAVAAGGKKALQFGAILADLPLPVLVGAPLLVLLLLLTLIFQDEINSLFDQAGTGPVTEESVAPDKNGLRPLKLPAPFTNEQQQDSATAAATGPVEEQPVVAETPVSSVELPGLMSPQDDSLGSQREAVAADESPAAPDVSAAADEPAPGKIAAPATDGAVTSSANHMLPAEPITAKDTPATDVQPDVTDTDAPNAEATQAANGSAGATTDGAATAGAATEGTAPGGAAAEDVPVDPAPVAVKAESVKGQKWILTRTPEAYTLQLLGVRDEAAARRFISRHRLTGEVAYFKTIRSGQPWYSVIYGVYPDRAAALQGREALPSVLQKSDLWPRTYASIQAAIGQ